LCQFTWQPEAPPYGLDEQEAIYGLVRAQVVGWVLHFFASLRIRSKHFSPTTDGSVSWSLKGNYLLDAQSHFDV